MDQYSIETGSKKALAFPPHFSLWGDFEIKDGDFHSLTAELGLVADQHASLEVHASKYGFYPWRIVYLDIDKTDKLQSLHNAVLDIVQKFRTPWMSQMLVESTHFGPEQKDSIMRYGYQFAGKYFSPHFTLAGNDMTDQAFHDLTKKLTSQHEDISACIASIALVERDSGQNKIVWRSA